MVMFLWRSNHRLFRLNKNQSNISQYVKEPFVLCWLNFLSFPLTSIYNRPHPKLNTLSKNFYTFLLFVHFHVFITGIKKGHPCSRMTFMCMRLYFKLPFAFLYPPCFILYPPQNSALPGTMDVSTDVGRPHDCVNADVCMDKVIELALVFFSTIYNRTPSLYF